MFALASSPAAGGGLGPKPRPSGGASRMRPQRLSFASPRPRPRHRTAMRAALGSSNGGGGPDGGGDPSVPLVRRLVDAAKAAASSAAAAGNGVLDALNERGWAANFALFEWLAFSPEQVSKLGQQSVAGIYSIHAHAKRAPPAELLAQLEDALVRVGTEMDLEDLEGTLWSHEVLRLVPGDAAWRALEAAAVRLAPAMDPEAASYVCSHFFRASRKGRKAADGTLAALEAAVVRVAGGCLRTSTPPTLTRMSIHPGKK